jgi:hypothetical protein
LQVGLGPVSARLAPDQHAHVARSADRGVGRLSGCAWGPSPLQSTGGSPLRDRQGQMGASVDGGPRSMWPRPWQAWLRSTCWWKPSEGLELLPMTIVTYAHRPKRARKRKAQAAALERAGDRACGEEGPSCRRRHRRR